MTANRQLKTKLIPLKDHYKLGYLYIADITVPHITIRNHKSKSRLSIDSPLQFKSKKIKKQNIKVTQYINSKENFISIKKAEKLKNGYHLICPYKIYYFNYFLYKIETYYSIVSIFTFIFGIKGFSQLSRGLMIMFFLNSFLSK